MVILFCANLTLEETISYYKNQHLKGIAVSPVSIPDLHFTKIVEEPFRGNIHLSMVFSDSIGASEIDFLIGALYALGYDERDISYELSNYAIQDYSFERMNKEISIPLAREILNQHKITSDKCIFIHKLNDKDELTFLIKTISGYIFLQETYWKS